MELSRPMVMLVLGLSLYVVNLGLHVAIGLSYQTMRDCHRSIHIEKSNFSLDEVIRQIEDKGPQIMDTGLDNGHSSSSSWLRSSLESSLLLRLHDEMIQVIPVHWSTQLSRIVDFQLRSHSASDISDKCLFNNQSFESIFDLSLNHLCRSAFSQEHREVLTTVFSNVNAHEEDAIVKAVMKGDNILAVANLVQALDLDVSPLVFEVFKRFTAALEDEERAQLAALLNTQWMQSRLPSLLTTMSDLDPSDISSLSETFSKIEVTNLPRVDELMRTLNVTLVKFVSDPSLFVRFYRDPELSKVLLEVQKLLPQFEPEELNSVVKIKNVFEQSPLAQEALQRLMQLPLDLLLKLVANAPNQEEMEALKKLNVIAKSEEVQSVFRVAKELDLMSEEGRSAFLTRCNLDVLEVRCEDDQVDLCSNGHITFVLAVCIALAVPGIVVAISEFVFRRGFSLVPLHCEDVDGDGINDDNGGAVGAGWPLLIKIVLLPLYIVAMIVLTPAFVVLGYVRLMVGKWEERESMRLMEQTLLLQHLVATLNGFPQMVINAAALMLLINLNAGSIIAGVTTENFFRALFPMTCASLILGFIQGLFTSWNVHTSDLRSKLDKSSMPKSSLPIFVLWFTLTRISQLFTLLLLFFVMWLEIFSNTLTASSSLLNVHLLVPILLLSIVPINTWLHRRHIGDQICLGITSAIFPTRFLHGSELASTEQFLRWNQLSFLLVPTSCFLLYSLLLLIMHLETIGLLKFFPMIATASALGPLVAIVYYRMVVVSLYKKDKEEQEEDLEEEEEEEEEVEPLVITLWKLFSIAVRLISLVSLIVVFSSHFFMVGQAEGLFLFHFSMFLLFLGLLFLLNIGLHMSLTKSNSVSMAIVSMLVANSFHLITNLNAAALYLVLNLILNFVSHLSAFLVLAFFCWSCTRVLSLHRLMILLPIVVLLWVLHAFFSLYVWNTCIRPRLEARRKRDNSNRVEDSEQNKVKSQKVQS